MKRTSNKTSKIQSGTPTSLTIQQVFELLEKSNMKAVLVGDGYRIHTIHPEGKLPDIEFTAGWLDVCPIIRYSRKVVEAHIERMKAESDLAWRMQTIASDKQKMASVISEMSAYGVLQDENTGAFFYQEDGRILFWTDIDMVIECMAEYPEMSIKQILETMKQSVIKENGCQSNN